MAFSDWPAGPATLYATYVAAMAMLVLQVFFMTHTRRR